VWRVERKPPPARWRTGSLRSPSQTLCTAQPVRELQ